MEIINTLGRRKTSVARVYLSKGTGKVTVNKKDVTEFFSSSIITGENSKTIRID